MQPDTDMERFATLDFEASSLSQESRPIEVCLSWLENGKVRTWSTLIRRAQCWDLADWAPQSAAVHGIALEEVQEAPVACAVVDNLFEQLRDRVLVSDAPAFEARWLFQLMKASGRATVPAIEDYHRISLANFSGMALDMLYETNERRPLPHRAGPDSARLADAWRKAIQY